jgi:hypothetical protein
VSHYQRKIQTGLFVAPARTRTQKRDLEALPQRNQELTQLLQDANLLILALNTLIDVAGQELKVPIRKKSGTKRSHGGRAKSWHRGASGACAGCLV